MPAARDRLPFRRTDEPRAGAASLRSPVLRERVPPARRKGNGLIFGELSGVFPADRMAALLVVARYGTAPAYEGVKQQTVSPWHPSRRSAVAFDAPQPRVRHCSQ